MRAGWDRKHWVGWTTRIIVALMMLVDPRTVLAGLPRQGRAPSVAETESLCDLYPIALNSQTVAGASVWHLGRHGQLQEELPELLDHRDDSQL